MDKIQLCISILLIFKINVTNGTKRASQSYSKTHGLMNLESSYKMPIMSTSASTNGSILPTTKIEKYFNNSKSHFSGNHTSNSSSFKMTSGTEEHFQISYSSKIYKTNLVQSLPQETSKPYSYLLQTTSNFIHSTSSYSNHHITKTQSVFRPKNFSIYFHQNKSLNVDTTSSESHHITKTQSAFQSKNFSIYFHQNKSFNVYTTSSESHHITKTQSAFQSKNFSTYFHQNKSFNVHTTASERFANNTKLVKAINNKSSSFIRYSTPKQPTSHLKNQQTTSQPYILSYPFKMSFNTPSHIVSLETSSELKTSPKSLINTHQIWVTLSSTIILPSKVKSFSKYSHFNSIYPSWLLGTNSVARKTIYSYPYKSEIEKSKKHLHLSTILVKNNGKETKLREKYTTSLPVWIAIITAVGAFLVITVISAVAYKFVKWNKDHGDYTLWVTNLELKPVNSRNIEVLT